MRVTIKRQLTSYSLGECLECLFICSTQMSKDVLTLCVLVQILIIITVSGEQIVQFLDETTDGRNKLDKTFGNENNTEVIAYDGKEIYSCPIKARNLSGRTGRGDTTFAAYINERLTSNIKTALLYATATVSLKMETPGPFKGTRADIDAYINEFFSDVK